MRCGDCVLYLTDEDESGNVTEFHHCETEHGFCGILDLFTGRNKDDKACKDFVKYDDERS